MGACPFHRSDVRNGVDRARGRDFVVRWTAARDGGRGKRSGAETPSWTAARCRTGRAAAAVGLWGRVRKGALRTEEEGLRSMAGVVVGIGILGMRAKYPVRGRQIWTLPIRRR